MSGREPGKAGITSHSIDVDTEAQQGAGWMSVTCHRAGLFDSKAHGLEHEHLAIAAGTPDFPR